MTVLFADMSRSLETTAALSPEDGATLVNHLLEAMVDNVLKYEGRVDRFLGDGVLAVFGAPQAHEDDPERAIRAALAIREAAQQLELQVTCGLNTGEVYFGAVGPAGHREVTVMGPIVNLASRLQGQAEPGRILVGEETYRQTRRAFAFAPRVLEVRGLEQPITAYAVEGALSRPEKVRGLEGLRAKLIGREEEWTSLNAALERLLHGQGRVVTLIGEAGIGKSRLVAELKQGIGCGVLGLGNGTPDLLPLPPNTQHPTPNTQHPTPLWLEGRCVELSAATVYAPFLDLLRGFFAWRAEEPAPVRSERFLAKLQELAGGGTLPDAQVAEIAPLLGRLLSLRLGPQWEDRLVGAGPEQIKQRTFRAFRDFFQTLSQRQPLILVLEDLHWADRLSLELIGLLIETVSRAPILLVCTYRPEREHPCLQLGTSAAQKCPACYTALNLRQLSPSQSRLLLESFAGIQDLLRPVKEAVVEKAGGNPFFIEELIRSLVETGTVYQQAGVWQSRAGFDTLTVPASLQGLIVTRVDQLDAEVKQILQGAAVIGRFFSRRLLAQVVPREIDLEAALQELEARALIHPDPSLPEEEYSFQHALTQEAVYRSILRRRRSGLHEQAAAAIERIYAENLEPHYEALAHHYVESGPIEKALEYLSQAGEKAKRTSANEAAILYFQQALDLLEKLPESPERHQRELTLQIGLGAPLIATKGAASPEVERAYSRAREVCAHVGEVRQLFHVLWGLWLCHYVRGAFPRARELGQELLALADCRQDPLLLLTAHRALGGTLMWLGELSSSREHLEAAIRLYDPEQYRAVASAYGHDAGVFCLGYLAHDLWLLGYPEQALRRSEEAVTLARQLSHPFDLALALCIAAMIHQFRGEPEASQAKAEELIAVATKLGFPYWKGLGSILRGWARSERGETEAGPAEMREGMAASRGTGAALGGSYFLSLLAEEYGKAGKAAEGLTLLDEALAAAKRMEEHSHRAELHRLRGELLLARAESDAQISPAEEEAESCFRQAIAIAQSQGAKSWELRAGIGLSRLLERQGRPNEARALLREIYGWFTEGFETTDLKVGRALLGRLA